jgi:hypothetical protein
MKRALSFSAPLTVGALTLLTAAPAFAQDYDGDALEVFAGCGIWLCLAVPGLLISVLMIWMLIDAILRQEHEFPNSSGNSKLIWILLLVFVGWIAAILYYFMVFKKIKRGSGGPPPASGMPGGYGYQQTPPPAPPAGSYPPPAPPSDYPPPAPPAS